jgi:LysW-gamma-L-lysine carboxypeptidase
MSALSQHTEARELLVKLVRIPSVSGTEQPCARQLANFFEDHDREAWLDDLGNVHSPGDEDVLLTSHIDTVPGDIPVRIEQNDEGQDVLWGRGSVDAKGPLASMAAAAVETGASFIGVIGEEVDSRGARHVVEMTDIEPELVINGEPSGWNGITLGYRGILGGTYVATSESGHTSRPENNAIQDAMDWWQRVEDEFEHDEFKPVFERVTCKPVEIEGGVSDDGLAVETTMDVKLRVPPRFTVDEVREMADGHLEGGTVNWYDRVEPVMESARTDLARTFRKTIRQEGGDPRLLRKTGTSDMNVFANHWDCQIVSYGPGDSDLDHAPDEHLVLDEYDKAVAVLVGVTNDLLEEL